MSAMRGGGLDRGDADLADELGAALDEHFGVVHDAVFVAEVEDDEVPGGVNGEDAAFEAIAHRSA